jgi:hypothetical protein
MKKTFLFLPYLFFLLSALESNAQSGLTSYDRFEIRSGDLVWENTYRYAISPDSMRHAVVQMLKSKSYTHNVIRNEIGYNGEIHHYQVDCEKYGRKYSNTPRMYWDGEWMAKFVIQTAEGAYRVTVYAFYYEKTEREPGYYTIEKPVKGKYLDAVTVKNKSSFRKSELRNLSLMNLSLLDEFDIAKARKLIQ